ncbi:MAG TPA: von Willebrand factor type A domain-containing protein [Nannocystaceae bacterium]|nr:von Willebrand factor type A domain-containing protein [Nannocystaceae bacterium]
MVGIAACGGPALGPAVHEEPCGDASSSSDAVPDAPPSRCMHVGPLDSGDANWPKPPYEPPGDTPGDDDEGGSSEAESGAGDESEGGGDDGYETGGFVGFIQDPDGGGVSIECDIWAQDCPEGEKCMPWANDGGPEWNATRCSPLDPMADAPGDQCSVEGSGVSGIDSCEIDAMCWDPNRELQGTCISFCEGNEANPICPPDQWCFQGYEGTLHVCLDDDVCAADSVCRCMCPADPDCVEGGQCEPLPDEAQMLADLAARRRPNAQVSETCPETTDPIVLYMSNDDSNSQASPALVRRTIREGRLVDRTRVRIHEFLNYYELGGENPSDVAARVGMELRRTDADIGELTLAVQAAGRHMDCDDRPPFNIVFSLDTSGSIHGEPLETMRAVIRAAAGQLREGDVVSVVSWNEEQEILLSGHAVEGPDDAQLLAAVNAIYTGGKTDLAGGLVAAYQLARAHRIDDGINRVILISDGGSNAGVTDVDLIASEAGDGDQEGTYLVGVGIGEAADYRDSLMDEVTDVGKGAYVFIDSTEEAEHMFGERFLANLTVAARNVRLQLTLPWYFGVKKFHGEDFSPIPGEVDPQHLAANDTMTFHQIIAACDPSLIQGCDEITARVDYVDPITGVSGFDEVSAPLADLVQQGSATLRKADAIVGYAKALIVISVLTDQGRWVEARAIAEAMAGWAAQAAGELGGDAELQEIASLMDAYADLLDV